MADPRPGTCATDLALFRAHESSLTRIGDKYPPTWRCDICYTTVRSPVPRPPLPHCAECDEVATALWLTPGEPGLDLCRAHFDQRMQADRESVMDSVLEDVAA